MVDGIRRVAIPLSDVPRAASFYADVLGFERVGPDDPDATVGTADYFWLDAGGGTWVNLAARPDATLDHPGEPDDPHVAFGAADAEIEAVAERLADRGVGVRESRTSVYFTTRTATSWN